MTQTHAAAALEEITSISWTPRGATPDPQQVRLIKDYLTRSAELARRLDCLGNWPFVDFAQALMPDLDLPRETAEALRVKINAREDERIARRPIDHLQAWHCAQQARQELRAYLPFLSDPGAAQ